MKRQTIFLCVALMLATMLPMSAAAFSDIRDDEVRVAAETLAALDIVTGFEDGSFRPHQHADQGPVCQDGRAEHGQ